MDTALEPVRVVAVEQAATLHPSGELMRAILDAASNPAVDAAKVQALTALMNAQIDRERRDAYWSDMRACQDELRQHPVVKNRVNDQTRSPYADMAAIEKVARPIYTRYGFAISFNPGAPPYKEGNIRVEAKVLHRSGHVEPYSFEAPPDSVGLKGNANKTGVQGAVSTRTYLERVLTCSIFNLIVLKPDQDGNIGSGGLSDEQTQRLNDLLDAMRDRKGWNDAKIKDFLRVFEADSMESLREMHYQPAVNMLTRYLQAGPR